MPFLRLISVEVREVAVRLVRWRELFKGIFKGVCSVPVVRTLRRCLQQPEEPLNTRLDSTISSVTKNCFQKSEDSFLSNFA